MSFRYLVDARFWKTIINAALVAVCRTLRFFTNNLEMGLPANLVNSGFLSNRSVFATSFLLD